MCCPCVPCQKSCPQRPSNYARLHGKEPNSGFSAPCSAQEQRRGRSSSSRTSNRMRKLLFTWLLALSIVGQTSCPARGGLPAPKIDDFQLSDYQGAVHKLSDWRADKLLVVVFLNIECPLAKLYGPRLAELANTFAHHGVGFVGISC